MYVFMNKKPILRTLHHATHNTWCSPSVLWFAGDDVNVKDAKGAQRICIRGMRDRNRAVHGYGSKHVVEGNVSHIEWSLTLKKCLSS